MASSLRTRDSSKIHISSAFDAGNIIAGNVSDPSNIKLQIRPDPECKKDGGKTHFQWFHFQVSGACLSSPVQRCLVLPPLSLSPCLPVRRRCWSAAGHAHHKRRGG